jgi:hypothetical protein
MKTHAQAMAILAPKQARKRSVAAPKLFVAATWTLDSVTVPVRLVSEANASQREHWSHKHRRTKAVRGAVQAALMVHRAPPLPLDVTITRIAPRGLDDDNNVRACKAVRDQVAAWLGVDDRDPRVTWRYGQERGKPRTYGVKITWKEKRQ